MLDAVIDFCFEFLVFATQNSQRKGMNLDDFSNKISKHEYPTFTQRFKGKKKKEDLRQVPILELDFLSFLEIVITLDLALFNVENNTGYERK